MLITYIMSMIISKWTWFTLNLWKNNGKKGDIMVNLWYRRNYVIQSRFLPTHIFVQISILCLCCLQKILVKWMWSNLLGKTNTKQNGLRNVIYIVRSCDELPMFDSIWNIIIIIRKLIRKVIYILLKYLLCCVIFKTWN